MPRARGISIAFIITVGLALSSPTCLSQSAARAQAGEDLLLMKLSPGRWFHEVQGDVRSIVTEQYRLEEKNGRMVETRTGSTETSYFDRRGFATESIEDGEGRTLWKYDAQGRVTEATMWFNALLVSRDVYTYDLEQRRVMVETYFLGLDELRVREVSVFDSRWNQTRKETERFDEDDSQQPTKDVVVYSLTYDSKGRVIATSISDEQGATSDKSTEEYDDSNRLIKSVNYQYDAATARLITKGINTYEKGGLLQTYSEYDARGRLLMRETRTRELDEHGNWITERQVTTLYDQGPQRSFTLIKRRRITFY